MHTKNTNDVRLLAPMRLAMSLFTLQCLVSFGAVQAASSTSQNFGPSAGVTIINGKVAQSNCDAVFAYRVFAIDDVTGDGQVDVAIEDRDYNSGNICTVHVYSIADRRIVFTVDRNRFPNLLTVKRLGSIDGDTIAELGVVLRTSALPALDNSGVGGSAALEVYKGQSFELMMRVVGSSIITGGGDFDGDGKSDFGIAVPSNLAANEYRSIKFYGIDGPLACDEYRSPVGVNITDGFHVLMQPNAASTGQIVFTEKRDSGELAVVCYSPKDNKVVFRIPLETTLMNSVAHVRRLHDIDGDCIEDIAVLWLRQGESSAINIYSGARGGLVIAIMEDDLNKLLPGDLDRGYGSACSAVSDLDRDGFREIAVGMEDYGFITGGVVIYSGRTGDVHATVIGGRSDSHFGGGIGYGADWNSDGVDDFWINSTPLLDDYRGDVGFRVYSGTDASLIRRITSVQELEVR